MHIEKISINHFNDKSLNKFSEIKIFKRVC